MTPAHKISVMFVCIGNSCRSPMAEGIARGLASDVMEVSSAGLSPLGVVQKQSLQTLEVNGFLSDGLSSKPIFRDAWDAAEIVINMSGYARERAFADYTKVEDWDIEDPYGEAPEVYQRIFEDIRGRVVDLIERVRRRREREYGLSQGEFI